jgi:hypothetical protein
MQVIITAIALAFALLLPVGNAGAEIYTYKDAQGRTVFVDDAHKIPSQYRGASSSIQERRDQPVAVTEEGTEGEKIEPPAQSFVDRETQMRARQQADMLDRERAYQTPVMVRGNRVLVPVEIFVGNRSANLMLLLDTGATITVLHRPSVKDLSFATGEQIRAQVAGGRTVKADKTTVRLVDIGPFELKDFPVMLIDPQGANLPFDGMLGMDFLKDHPYEIDYNNEIVRWKPTPQ